MYRAEQSRHTEGTGLGLCIAREIMRRKGGNITVSSTVTGYSYKIVSVLSSHRKPNIYTYSLKSFRQNISKGIIFMIALAVTLMSAVLNIATTVQETIYRENVNVNTDAQVKYIN